jgi:hypothetical protein
MSRIVTRTIFAAKPGAGPRGGVLTDIFGQHQAQVVLIDDQQPVETLTAQETDEQARIREIAVIRLLAYPSVSYLKETRSLVR